MKEDFDDESFKEIGAEASACLGWILSGMGIEARIEVSFRDGDVLLNVLCGENGSIAIGRKGQTLEALQVLVSRITARSFPQLTANTRVLVDIEGYRERRRHNLIDMAHRTADEVRETGEVAFLDPLNAYERFLIHDALKDDTEIDTSSRGDGTMKQILISPASGNKD